MRKTLFSLLAVLFLAAPLSAQYFGLRAGVNSTNANFDFDDAEVDVDGETNLMLGIFLDLPLLSDFISIQPELNYLNRGFSYEASIAGLVSREQTVSFIDLGAILRLNFGREEGLGFYLGAGPTFSYAVSGSITEAGEERDVDFDADRINRSGLEFAALAGITIDIGAKLFVEARYNGSLYDADDRDDADVRQRSVGINGGVMIPF